MSSFTSALKRNNIEFIAKKDGSPHMGKSKNKMLYLRYISGEFDDNKKDVCVICMENNIDESFAKTQCGHKFCINCFSIHIRLKSDCPMCRTVLCKTTSIYSAQELLPIVTEDIMSRNIRIDMPLNIFNWYNWLTGYYQFKIKLRIICLCMRVLESITSMN